MTGNAIRGVVGAILLGGLAPVLAGDPQAGDKPGGGDPVTLVDSTGKELKLTGVKLTVGVRRLAWLADTKGTTDDAKRGPLAVEVRELNSTTYQKGVATLVPAASVEAVRYEYANQLMTVAVKGLAEPVTGTLHFRGINVFGLEGDAGGVVAKFSGGAAKDGFKSVAFPGAKPLPTRPPGGTAWTVQIDQPKAGNPLLTVRNIKALYQFPGGIEQLVDALPVRKGDPLLLNPALKKLEVLAVDLNTQIAAFEVATEGGMDRLVAVPLTLEQDRRIGTLAGLVGEVDCGWKLFPLHTIKVVKPEEKK
ncbi:MAG: hypothetical protein JWO38_14 [Gemmataceae bacterium]|nr:hypothetical protein [Gemmataceae bacterium]